VKQEWKQKEKVRKRKKEDNLFIKGMNFFLKKNEKRGKKRQRLFFFSLFFCFFYF
jgi:hypothetical protein